MLSYVHTYSYTICTGFQSLIYAYHKEIISSLNSGTMHSVHYYNTITLQECLMIMTINKIISSKTCIFEFTSIPWSIFLRFIHLAVHVLTTLHTFNIESQVSAHLSKQSSNLCYFPVVKCLLELSPNHYNCDCNQFFIHNYDIAAYWLFLTCKSS